VEQLQGQEGQVIIIPTDSLTCLTHLVTHSLTRSTQVGSVEQLQGQERQVIYIQ
jgi:hypothetical protein